MSSSYGEKFNVFLSFRGHETRRTFVSHLRYALDRRGITTLEDKNEFRGTKWDPSVFDRTIKESKVAVVLISENYASSPWCLESLVKILGFNHSGSLVVLPVFYEIDSSDVRKQSGKLLQPFLLHERENRANVQTWRQALSQLADIPNCMYSNNWKGDAEMISKISDDIWGIMIGSKSSDLCGLVGMDRHMKAIYRLLDLEFKEDEVRQILISGKHGIGKTELVKYLCEEVSHHFDINIWLDAPKKQHIHGYDRDYDSRFSDELRYKLRRSKYRDHRPRVLLVVEDVTEPNLVRTFARNSNILGQGSKIIITMVENNYVGSDVDFSYEVVGLEFSEALQLFCLHAFQQTHPFFGFEDLSCRAVKLTDGNPPTIKELGRGLSGKDRYEWEVILAGYERSSYKYFYFCKASSSVMASVSTQSSTSDRLVGMARNMKALNQLLELESDKIVRVVSIWGTGGIGKTTLAKYVYDGISQQFDTHVFLETIEDNSSSMCLEEMFLSKAIERDAYTIRNSKDGYDIAKSGLMRQKVLLIVDGVDNSKALDDIWKIASCFGPGSRVIVTTRDESLLLANGMKHVYEMKCLRFDEALQLFYRFALKEKSPSLRFKQLSVRAIKLVGFLPLALKVTGSNLYGKDEQFWETTLQSFEEKQD